MSGCNYCRRKQSFWATDTNGNTVYQYAHIIPDTNVFSDTAGRHINFRYCPMCGESLLIHPDNKSGLSGVFSCLFPAQAYNTLKRKECANHGK